MFEEIEFDPAIRDVASDRQRAETMARLDAATERMDKYFERLETAPTSTRRELSKAFRSELLGVDEAELEAIQDPAKASFTKTLSKASLSGLLDMRKHSGDANFQKAFNCLEKSYRHSATLVEAMTATKDLFADQMNGDEFSLAQRAIAAADVPCFLRVLSQATKRGE